MECNYKDLYETEQIKNQELETCISSKSGLVEKLYLDIDTMEKQLEELKRTIISLTNSNTAKNGYNEERLVCDDLNQRCFQNIFASLLTANYEDFHQVEGNTKTDIQTKDKMLSAQVKKYKKGQFQQLDRHWVDYFIKSIPELIDYASIFKDICEYPILSNGTHVDKTIPLKKLCESCYSQETLQSFITALNKYKKQILSYAFLGNDTETKPEYLFGVEYIETKRTKIVLFKIKNIMDYLETLDFKISPKKTGITLGNEGIFSLQRKGGDAGRKGSNQLQIKIIVSKLLEKVENIEYLL